MGISFEMADVDAGQRLLRHCRELAERWLRFEARSNRESVSGVTAAVGAERHSSGAQGLALLLLRRRVCTPGR